MNAHPILLTASLLHSLTIFSFSIRPEPLCSVYTQNSVFGKLAPVGNRKRYSTCTGVAWFHDNYIAVLNLSGENIVTYKFDKKKKEFTLVQTITNKDGARLSYSENLAISPDGRLLAVANASSHYVTIYTIDENTHVINPAPIIFLPCHGFIHGVRFSPDSNYVAYTSFDRDESVCVLRITNNAGSISLKSVCNRSNSTELKTKSINFTRDGRYAALVCTRSCGEKCPTFKNILTIHRFNLQKGTIGEMVCSMPGNFFAEDIAFSRNNDAIILSEQGTDALIIYPFDPETGQIDPNYTSIQNPEAQLSFPHGICISDDGKRLAVACYGGDKFNLYQVN